MTLWLILASALIIIMLITAFLLRAFRNPVRVHEKTPKEIGISCEEISIPTKNNKELYGWWIEGKVTKPVLILIHGWGRNVGKMMPYIKNLQPKDYNLLIFDSRNHGHSDPDDYSSMLKFAEDIKASVDFLENRKATQNGVGLIGLSIGGGAAIYAAAHDSRIDSVVTVGAFANPAEVMRKQLADRHIPYIPFVWLLFKFIELRIGAKFSNIAPVNNVAKAKARFLFVHGKKDTVVPLEQGEQLIKAANPKNAKLIVYQTKAHSNCHFAKGFWETVDDFFMNDSTVEH
jgi:pimeloyl-ACP methyl ester carboxylesterase